MNKNLEDLKSRRYEDGNYEIAFRYCLIKVLEDFEIRLSKLEREEEGFRPKIRLIKEVPMKKGGLNEIPAISRPKKRPKKGQRTIKSGRIDYLEIGAQIGKSREGPKLIKSGHGIKPRIKRPKPKPRPKVIYNYKIGGTDPD